MSHHQQEDDRAASEWETVAGDDDFVVPIEMVPLPPRQLRASPSTDDGPAYETGHSLPPRTLLRQRPAAVGPHENAPGELKTSCSKSSSSVSADRFKRAPLRAGTAIEMQPPAGPSPKRMRVEPDGVRGENPEEAPATMHAISFDTDGAAHALARARMTALDTDTDWQTVTTEQPPEPIREIELNFAKGAGSSLADVSDASEDITDQARHRSTDGVLGKTFSPRESTSDLFGLKQLIKRSQRDRSRSRMASTDSCQREALKMPQIPPRAAQAKRRVSNPFRLESIVVKREKSSTVFEMKPLRNSYESLDSEPPLRGDADRQRREGEFGWSPDQNSPKEAFPNALSTAIEKQPHGPAASQTGGDRCEGLPGRDGPSHDVSRLPFPLISLPEAARLQSFRRERGQEDHTDSPGFFAAKARSVRSGTVSTLSSVNSPVTPLSAFIDWQARASATEPVRPATAHRSRRVRERPTLSVDTTDSLLYRISTGRDKAGPWAGYRDASGARASRGSASVLDARVHRLRGFSSSTRQRSGDRPRDSFELLCRSEMGLFRPAQDDVLLGLDFSHKDGSSDRVFVGIVAVTLLFPLVGLVALCGRFDSAISWCSQGQVHSLSTKQRSILKRQLLAEAVVYPVLITMLSVHYSVRGP
ncbi:hypothetical protein CDD83_2537 [Cordyceps sp. RAO-2017]|nr:hypothetical protein CDD83_2537 [Cordyceps sp. RAO-2017]